MGVRLVGGPEPHRERALSAAVRELAEKDGWHRTVRDRFPRVQLLAQFPMVHHDVDRRGELLTVRQRLVAEHLQLDTIRRAGIERVQ